MRGADRRENYATVLRNSGHGFTRMEKAGKARLARAFNPRPSPLIPGKIFFSRGCAGIHGDGKTRMGLGLDPLHPLYPGLKIFFGQDEGDKRDKSGMCGCGMDGLKGVVSMGVRKEGAEV